MASAKHSILQPHNKIHTKEEDTMTTLGIYLEDFVVAMTNYSILGKETLVNLWQYVEFRVMIYTFMGLSSIPLGVFIVFCTCLWSLLFFIASGIWLFFCTIGFFILLPFLIGSLSLAVGLAFVYQVYLHFTHAGNDRNNNKEDEHDDDNRNIEEDIKMNHFMTSKKASSISAKST